MLRLGRLLVAFLIPLVHEVWPGYRSGASTIGVIVAAALFYFWPEIRVFLPVRAVWDRVRSWVGRRTVAGPQFLSIAPPVTAPVVERVPSARDDAGFAAQALRGFAESGEALARWCIEERGSAAARAEAERWFAAVSVYIRDALGPECAARFREAPKSSFAIGASAEFGVLYGIGACVVRLQEFIREIESAEEAPVSREPDRGLEAAALPIAPPGQEGWLRQ